jgi:large subunit ribosomal protein L22
MIIKSTQKFIRTSPRKLRLVAGSVRGMDAQKALIALKFLDKAAAAPLAKVINTAIHDAANNHNLDRTKLKLNSIEINPGPTLKRGRAVSRGQYHSVKKRTSHITVKLISPDK